MKRQLIVLVVLKLMAINIAQANCLLTTKKELPSDIMDALLLKKYQVELDENTKQPSIRFEQFKVVKKKKLLRTKVKYISKISIGAADKGDFIFKSKAVIKRQHLNLGNLFNYQNVLAKVQRPNLDKSAKKLAKQIKAHLISCREVE